MKKIFLLLIVFIAFSYKVSAQELCDSIAVSQSSVPDSISQNGSLSTSDYRLIPSNSQLSSPDTTTLTPRDKDYWKQQLLRGKLDLKDTTIVYPKFIGFCVDVYNWADRTFNSYDPQYVVGTGRRWKAIIKNDNWTDSYVMHFNKHMPIHMVSDINYTIGAHLSYMAVSIGYTLDINKLIGKQSSGHKKFEFNFSCALFSADAYYSENKGGTKIRNFGSYNDGDWMSYDFPSFSQRSYGVDVYYFFNNRKYSQGAAYNFSKIQLKSAGSLIAGITISNHNIDIDFSSLPTEMQETLPTDQRQFRFHYNDYCFLIGYGYNCVMGKHWLFNISALPSIGFKHSFANSVDGKKDLFSTNIKGKFSFTYNFKDLFAGLAGKVDGHWYMNSNYNFFNFYMSLALSVGFRF